MSRLRLDQALAARGLVSTRSQAESYIKLGKVRVNGKILNPSTSLGAGKTGYLVSENDVLEVTQDVQYVSRAGLKLAGAADQLGLNFKDKVVLDVGSSTGGFTDYALRHKAKKVMAVDVGTDQLHPSLRDHPKVESHERTDIREFRPVTNPDLVLIDVSFISLRQILPHIADICSNKTQIVAMLKPQFEAGAKDTNKGVIKNDSIRRGILRDFEKWSNQYFIIEAKADSRIAGAKGNQERFYLLKKHKLN